MVEIIPAQKIKIIPWPEKEGLVVFQRTKDTILFTGLANYLKALSRKRTITPNAINQRKLPSNLQKDILIIEVSERQKDTDY